MFCCSLFPFPMVGLANREFHVASHCCLLATTHSTSSVCRPEAHSPAQQMSCQSESFKCERAKTLEVSDTFIPPPPPSQTIGDHLVITISKGLVSGNFSHQIGLSVDFCFVFLLLCSSFLCFLLISKLLLVHYMDKLQTCQSTLSSFGDIKSSCINMEPVPFAAVRAKPRAIWCRLYQISLLFFPPRALEDLEQQGYPWIDSHQISPLTLG